MFPMLGPLLKSGSHIKVDVAKQYPLTPEPLTIETVYIFNRTNSVDHFLNGRN